MRAVFLLLAAMVAPGGSALRVRRNTTAPIFPEPANPLWKSTWTDKLKQDLLLNYDKFARPMQHGNKTSVVLEPTIRHLELDEKRSILTIHGWVKMIWEDDKLKWDPSKYGGLKELHLADHEVWQPDVFPYNSATGSTIDHYGNTNLIAFGNGSVLWVPPTIFHVFCQLDFTWWPFDTQVCQLKIGSWTYNGEQVDLFNEEHSQAKYEMPELTPNAEWKFVKMSMKKNSVFYPCCPSPYVDLTFNFTIRRNSDTYSALVVKPVIVVIIMTLATFLLPPDSGDKVTLGGAAVLITCLFVLYFAMKMPMMAGSTPYIVTFYTRSLYLISFSIVISIFVINLARNPKTSPLPWVVKKNLTGWLGKCLLIKSIEQQKASKAEEMTDSQMVLSDQGRHLTDNSKAHQKDWLLLATAIDRISFLLYCFAFFVLVVAYPL